jgi:uncharacterized repeat protein (TIGR03803 family)
LIGLVAAIVAVSVVVLSGLELKHVPPAAPTYMVLHYFSGSSNDGANPVAGLILDAAGNLYGTTLAGGAESSACQASFSRCGVVFKLSPTGTETILHNFIGGADGANPGGSLILDAAGNLYGTTVLGGSATSTCDPPFGCGLVFELIPSHSSYEFKVLRNFIGGADGAQPSGGLIRDAAGNIYGTTFIGGGGGSSVCTAPAGPGCGTVFKLSATGTETILHRFASSDGRFPGRALIRDAAGNLYGTTGRGGADSTCDAPYGCGVVFELIRCSSAPSGYEFKVLHTFTGGADGAFPDAPLTQDVAGNLYGAAEEGGLHGAGVVFELSPAGTETVLYSFTGGADGAFPNGGLIRDAAGNLYGTTSAGGIEASGCDQPACGVVFRLSPTGTETVLHSFIAGPDGGESFSGLIQDAAGNLYGTTTYGGKSTCLTPPGGCGVVFRVAP